MSCVSRFKLKSFNRALSLRTKVDLSTYFKSVLRSFKAFVYVGIWEHCAVLFCKLTVLLKLRIQTFVNVIKE